jgi:hypothetical protein
MVIPMLNPIDRAMFVIPFAALLYLLLTNNETNVCRAGTSICEIVNRQKSRIIAIFGELAKGIASRNRLEGRCVYIIVAIHPIFLTSLVESKLLIALMILHNDNTLPTNSYYSSNLFCRK